MCIVDIQVDCSNLPNYRHIWPAVNHFMFLLS